MSEIQIQNMHQVMSLEIPSRTLERALKRIDALNKVKMATQGWIVDYIKTDSNGNYDEKGNHITGYFLRDGDPRHGQLITSSKIENKSTFHGYHVLTTSGLNPKPYLLLEWEVEDNE